MGAHERDLDRALTLRSIEVEGFGSYRTARRLEFRGGSTAVVGDNGSGKSTLASKALCWALYGKCSPEQMGSGTSALRGADVVANGVKACRVKVELQRGASTIAIERSRKLQGSERVTVLIDGAPSTVEPADVIGVDYEVFTRTVLRGQRDPWAFAEATDARRREIIDAVSGGQWVAPLFETAKAVRKDVAARLASVETALAVQARRLAGLPDEAAVRARAAAWDAAGADRVSMLRQQRQGLLALAEQRATARDQAAAALAQLAAPQLVDLAPYQAAVAATNSAHGYAVAALNQARGEVQRVSGLHGKVECPTCRQSVQGHVDAWLTAAKATAALAEAEVEAADRARDDARSGAMQATAYNAAHTLAYQQEHQRLSRVVADAGLHEPAIERIDVELAAAEAQVNPYTGELAVVADEHARCRREVAALEAERGLAVHDLTMADAWVDVLSPKGLRAHLADTALAQVATEANRWLAVLSAGRMVVDLATTRQTAKGAVKEEITLKVTMMEGGAAVERDLLQFSGGERARINLALDLGVAAAFGAKELALSLLVLDEHAFSGVDTAGKRAIVDAVNALGVHEVIVIDHDPALTGVLERTIRVERDSSGDSVLIEEGAR